MTKILVSMEERLLARIDKAARQAGLTRSAYLSRLAARDLGTDRGPGADPRARKAIADLRRLFSENPTPGDPTRIIRKMRDSR